MTNYGSPDWHLDIGIGRWCELCEAEFSAILEHGGDSPQAKAAQERYDLFEDHAWRVRRLLYGPGFPYRKVGPGDWRIERPNAR